MLLGIILGIILFFLLLFIDGFLVGLAGFNISIVIFLVAYNKFDWRLLSIFFIPFLLSVDVSINIPLGSSIIIMSICYGLVLLLSYFISMEDSLVSYLAKFVIVSIFYVLNLLIPNLLLLGNLGIHSLEDYLYIFFKALISIILLYLLDIGFSNVRGRERGVRISFK